MLIGAAACGPPSYATWIERADAAAVSSPVASSNIDPALLGYWRFDDAAGSATRDSSGRGHDGIIFANVGSPRPVWTTGRVEGALAFDGQTFVRIPYSPDWDRIGTTNAFTVVAWIIHQNTAIGWNTVVSRQYQGTQWEHFNLGFMDEYVTPITSTQINQYWYCTAPAPTVNGLWTHIAGTYDGTTLRGYQNGTEVCHLDITTTLVTDDTGIIIGGKTNTGGPTVEQPFTGLVDDLAIYSRALGASELADLAAGKAIVP